MGRKLWSLRDYGGVDIDYSPACRVKMYVDATEKAKAVRSLVAVVGVGEEMSYISEGGSSEERVAYSVKKNVCIGVTEKPRFVRNVHSAKYKLSAFDEAVNVIAVTYSYHFHSSAVLNSERFCRSLITPSATAMSS